MLFGELITSAPTSSLPRQCLGRILLTLCRSGGWAHAIFFATLASFIERFKSSSFAEHRLLVSWLLSFAEDLKQRSSSQSMHLRRLGTRATKLGFVLPGDAHFFFRFQPYVKISPSTAVVASRISPRLIRPVLAEQTPLMCWRFPPVYRG